MLHRIAIASIFCLCLSTVAAAQKRPMTIDDALNIKRVGNAVISPDGKSILYTVQQWDAAQAKEAKDKETNPADKPAKDPAKQSKKSKMEQHSHVWMRSEEHTSELQS